MVPKVKHNWMAAGQASTDHVYPHLLCQKPLYYPHIDVGMSLRGILKSVFSVFQVPAL